MTVLGLTAPAECRERALSFPCAAVLLLYNLRTMPRGKRTVFALFSTETNARLGTIRLHKQDKQGVSWKEHLAGMLKYDPAVRKRVAVKAKEEKHSSN